MTGLSRLKYHPLKLVEHFRQSTQPSSSQIASVWQSKVPASQVIAPEPSLAQKAQALAADYSAQQVSRSATVSQHPVQHNPSTEGTSSVFPGSGQTAAQTGAEPVLKHDENCCSVG